MDIRSLDCRVNKRVCPLVIRQRTGLSESERVAFFNADRLIILTRLSAKNDTVLSLSTPIVGLDGTVMDEIPVPKGCEVIIGILGANTSTHIWGEDALQWKPERWFDPLPSAVARNTLPGVSPNL